MKRDMNLIRLLLKALEDRENTTLGLKCPDNCPREKFEYHLDLLWEAGFITGEHQPTAHLGYDCLVLTWNGHDFLDAIRSDQVWTQVMKKITELGGKASLEVMKELAISECKTLLGL